MRQARKSSLFLIELMIAIFFFALSMAVCVRLFASAYLTSAESKHRDAALLHAQSIASVFQSNEGGFADVLAMTSAGERSKGWYQGVLQENGEEYLVSLVLAGDEEAGQGKLQTLTISIAVAAQQNADATGQTATGAQILPEPLVTMTVAAYWPLRKGA